METHVLHEQRPVLEIPGLLFRNVNQVTITGMCVYTYTYIVINIVYPISYTVT